jgi:hypothetical protein
MKNKPYPALLKGSYLFNEIKKRTPTSRETIPLRLYKWSNQDTKQISTVQRSTFNYFLKIKGILFYAQCCGTEKSALIWLIPMLPSFKGRINFWPVKERVKALFELHHFIVGVTAPAPTAPALNIMSNISGFFKNVTNWNSFFYFPYSHL